MNCEMREFSWEGVGILFEKMGVKMSSVGNVNENWSCYMGMGGNGEWESKTYTLHSTNFKHTV